MTEVELRALDAEIAIRFFGYKRGKRSRGDHDWLMPTTDKRYSEGYQQTPVLPPYSTDMRSAWLIVEKLSDCEYVKVRCESSNYHGNFCTVIAADQTQQLDSDIVKRDAIGVWGETMPVAICKAALIAAGHSKECEEDKRQ